MPSAISLRREQRWTSLYVLCIGMLMIVLDITVANVALPSIQHDLGFTSSTLAWVINAYLIAFAGLLLLSGRLGDLYGGKRIFVIGLGLFTASSFLCGIAWSAPLLVAARFAQGIGGAMASAVILAMIVTAFPEPGERARAIGVFSFTASAGGSVGLLLGGAITQTLGWHWAFLVNVPIGIITIAIGQRVIVAPAGIGRRHGADVIGAIAITASLMLGVYAVVQVPIAGVASPAILICAALSLVLFAAFLTRQISAKTPLVPLRLFHSRNLATANVLEMLLSAGLFGFFFLDALLLRRTQNYGALATGLAFLPLTITSGALSLGWAERLIGLFGGRRVLIGGSLLAFAGLLLLTIAPANAKYLASTFPAMVLIGTGMGAAFPPLMMFAMSGTTEADAGVASGVLATSSEVGGAVGLAVLATIASLGGFRAAFAGATACVAVAIVIAAIALEPDDALRVIDDERRDEPERA
ncbi:MAG TPA: MFS transporter [Alphaproteobacteria bacterium]|nr:MFS transporter [Alphaproteobacteria bacterium]